MKPYEPKPRAVLLAIEDIVLRGGLRQCDDKAYNERRASHEAEALANSRSPASSNVIDCGLALIVRTDGKILGVSRKDNPNDIGLPGGKCNDGESFRDTVIREVLEETGYVVQTMPHVPFDHVYMGLRCRTFICVINHHSKVSPIDPQETGEVGFHDKQVFSDGSFGEYNKMMFEHFKAWFD